MTRTLKNIAALLIIALLIGASATFITDLAGIGSDQRKDDISGELPNSNPLANVIGGKPGFITDFNSIRLISDRSNIFSMYMPMESGGLIKYPSPLWYEPEHSTVEISDGGELVYSCFSPGYDSVFPKFKFQPMSVEGKIYLNQFKVLTVDFDLNYFVSDSSYAHNFKALFNIRSDKTDSSVTDSNAYYQFLRTGNGYGKGHYTFILSNTEDQNMEITVYKNGVLVYAVSDFLNSEYDGSDLYVSCLNLELPLGFGDTVYLDNIQFYYFEKDYTGPITDLVEDPDINLKNCKDSVLYGG